MREWKCRSRTLLRMGRSDKSEVLLALCTLGMGTTDDAFQLDGGHLRPRHPSEEGGGGGGGDS